MQSYEAPTENQSDISPSLSSESEDRTSTRRLALLLAGLLILFVLFGFRDAISHFFGKSPPNPAQISQTQPLSPDQPSPALSPEPTPPPETTFLFTGDVMLDRNIRQAIEREGIEFVFAELSPIFHQHDLVVMNLEGPITTNQSVSTGTVPGSPNNFRFTFDPSVLDYLNQFPIIACIGNNHIRDWGLDGMQQTKQFYREAAIPFFGNSGFETSPEERVHIHQSESGAVAFVNYNQFVSGGYETAFEDLAYATSHAEFVILYPHWGNEYVTTAGSVIQNQAKAFLDAGADLIVGSHPHVVQQSEDIDGKRVYYSLGNTIFDQYFSTETRSGILVSARWKNSETPEYSEIEVQMDRSGQTRVLPNP